MILQIREGVFETNSSSTHTITICSEKTFDEWTKEDSDIVYVGDSYDFSFNGVEHFFDPDANSSSWSSESQAAEYGIYTFEEWREDEYLETYLEGYTTENGDKIVAFGKYGTQY